MPFATAEALRQPPPGRARRARIELLDGAKTTIHVAAHDLNRTEVRVKVLKGQARLEAWCRANGHEEAIVGGFFVRGTRPPALPLGELRTRGMVRAYVPFTAPYDQTRACVHSHQAVTIAPRDQLPSEPRGDLLQAGPLLVTDGNPIFRREEDREGFSAAHGQFDSDITDGRYPRAALGLSDTRLIAVAVDGRSRHDAGLTLEELAALMAALGCETALNLDGGGSTSLISGGKLRNRPRGDYERPEVGGRPVSTALLFVPRA